MHPMPAMFGGGIGRDGAIICFVEDRAGIGGGSRYGSEYIGIGWLFAEGSLSILRRAVDRAVAAVTCAIRQATRRRRRGFSENEKLDKGTDEEDDGKLAEEQALCERQSKEQGQ